MKKWLLSLITVFSASVFTVQAQYCAPTFTSACSSNDYIDLFSTTGGLTNITNVSTGCNGNPNNFVYNSTSTVSNVQGQGFSFSVQAGSSFGQGHRIWVDWNNDFDYSDPGEDMWNSGASSTAVYTGTITIPLSASPGIKRMRVRCNYASIPTDPCASQSFGEAEEFNLMVMSLGPCLSTPFVGPALTTKAITCAGESFSLSVDSLTYGSGQHYQWQKSTDNITFTNSVNDTNITLTTTQSTSHYYRLRVTCGAGTPVYSTSVLVTTTAIALPAGTYTIDGNFSTGGTNFNSFADFKQAIVCGGIGGPIVVNVLSKGSAYAEQIEFGVIGGASATNTITIRGNGQTLTSAGGTTYATLRFNGSKYFKIKNLKVAGTGTSNNFAVQLTGGAQYIEFDSCTVSINPASTSSLTAAFVVSGSLTSATTAGVSASHITVKNSIIEGGYYAFTLMGTGAGSLVENNVIRDFYLYGLYSSNQDSTIIRKNDINRSQRTGTITTFYGIYLSGTATDVQITGNRIHNSGDQNPLANYTAYPIFFSGANATAADPMFVTNNAIYEINTIGTVYAFYLSSGNFINFYHNTVNIDNQYATTSAGGIRAFCSFATTGTFDIRNNIFQVSHVGTGTKHLMYLSSTAPTYTLNYNQYSLTSTTGSNFFGYYGANVATFTAWKALNSSAYEANGVYGDAVFNPLNFYTPQSGVGDNMGTNLLSIVPTDLAGAARTTTPDIGAMEFVPLACLQPSILSGVATSTTMNITWQNVSGADSVRVEYGPTGFVQGTGVVVRRTGTNYTFTGLFPQTCYDFYFTSYCGGTIGNGTVKATYCTECAAQALPLFENFDGSLASNSTTNPGLPACWKYYKSKNHTGYAYTYSFLVPHSPLNHMRYYSGGTQVDTLAIISPALQGLTAGNKRTKFWAMSNSATYNQRVIVGTVASPSQMNTLDIIDTIVAGQSYAEYTVYLDSANGYNGTHEYVVFMQGSVNGTFQSLYVDDILIEQVPSCNPPTSISAPTIGTTTTQIAWTSLAGICFDIEYGPVGFIQGTGQGTLVTNVSSPYTATGLTPNTFYSAYVRDCCNPNLWAGPFTWKTNCLSQLNGTYTVGGTAGPNNFATIDSALNVLTGCGISGPVTFNLQGNSVKTLGSRIFNTISGASATNTVTFNGRGVAIDTLAFSAGSSVGFTFNGTKYVKFQNMTIDGATTSITVRMENNAQFLTFENCHIWNSPTTTTFSTAVIAASNVATSATGAGNNANDITIKNCKLVGGYYGISLYGSSTTLFSTNFTIEDNEFVDQYYYGLSLYYLGNINANRNNIHAFRNTFGYGIYAYYVSNVTFKQNEAFAPTYAMYLSQLNQVFAPTSNSEVSNNFLGGGTYGMYLSGYTKANIWHNSVRGGNSGFYAFTPGADLNIRNNIFVGGSGYAFYNGTNPTGTFVLNHNLYHTSGANLAYNGAAYATLAAWQTAQPTLNVNSLAGDPGFVSATDFHIIGTLANDVADNTVPVVIDIDDDIRPASGSTIKDMGADEYTPLNWDASLEAVIVPLGGCGDSTTTIDVVVKNFGLNTITSLPISVSLTGGLTATVSTTAAVSIPVGVTATVPVGTFNTYAGAAGVNFAATISLVGDQKASNNTKSVGPGNYIPVEPVTHGMIDTVCASVDSVDLWAIEIPGTKYSWYDAAIAGNKLFSATDSITVPTNGITTYYVGYDSATATPLLGTAAATTTSTYLTPYKTFYMDGRAQYLVLASELMAMGVAGGGAINSVAFDVVSAAAQTMNAFEIKIGGTSITQMTAAFQPAPTTVVFSQPYVAVTGWNVHTFTTPYIWNGSDNLLIEVCFDNNNFTSNSTVHYTTTAFPSVTDGYADLSASSGCTPGNIINQQVSNSRPDMQFNIKTIACSEVRKPVSFALSPDSAVAAFTSTVQANGADVNFNGTASSGQVYTWNFGDGNTGTGVTATHTYATAGTWTACLTVEDTTCGDIDSICKTVVTTIGIDESLLNQSLNVYPNPSNGKFRVEFSVEGLKNVSIRVNSLLGQTIYTSTPGNVSGSYRADLDLSSEATGVYIIQIITDDNVVSRRITIRK